MTETAARSTAWLQQALSDVRTAEAISRGGEPMRPGDIGCHVAALCGQSIEKSLKGYVILNRAEPAKDHRPDKYLTPLLNKQILGFEAHHPLLSKLFDPQTRSVVQNLLDRTPDSTGGVNTEYPWHARSSPETWQAPAGAFEFSSIEAREEWLRVTKRVSETLEKLRVSVARRHR